MPRKVTKTMREARQRAAAQKRARAEYKRSMYALNYSFGSNIHDEQRPLRIAGTVTGRISSTGLNSCAEPRSMPDATLNLDDIPESEKGVSIDFTSLERKVLSDAEYAQREEIAQKEIERKKSCIAPAYNKGAYQYISSAEQAKDVGKK